jgi:DNA mismatch repair protein MutS2
VLLDEPGTGTDPEDGAALAHVVLRELASRGAWVLATTHFQAVKMLALSTPRAKVAGVDFAPETFAPRYRLIYGSVGPSLGLTMARRLGFPEELLRAAESERSDLSRRFGDAVERLEAERRRFESAHAAIGDEREELRRLRAEHAELAAELREKRRKRWVEELSEAKQFTDELRREGRRLLTEAKRRPEMARQLESLAREQEAAIATRWSDLPSGEGPPGDSPPMLSIGDDVMVVGSQLSGTLLKLEGDRAQISRGAVRFDVPAKQLRRLEGTKRGSSQPPRAPAVRLVAAPDSHEEGTEINLIGSRVPAALERLELFLDRAAVQSLSSVRIVHGHGTGALRHAIHAFLAGSPYIARFEDADPRAGGSGATIAHLR